MLQRASHTESINRRWPFGTRVYELKVPKESHVLFDRLSHESQSKIETIFNKNSLCAVGTLKINGNLINTPIVYFVDTSDLDDLNESIRSYMNEFIHGSTGIVEDDLLSVMAVFDEDGKLHKDMEIGRFKDGVTFILACEIANIILAEISELSVVRWTIDDSDTDFNVYLKLEDTKEVCNILEMDSSLELVEDFHFTSIN